MSTAEAATSQRFPGYHHAKLLLLAWLLSSRYQVTPFFLPIFFVH